MSQKGKNIARSWSDFPISEKILMSLRDLKFKDPLPIQVRSFKASIIENKHVFGAARTGSGKTLAYAIPIVNLILKGHFNSSKLKRKICKSHRKKEDFELIDGDKVSVEDMIIDKLDNTDDEHDSSDVQSTDSNDSSKSDQVVEQYTCPEAIVLVPTRELAIQVKGEFDKICKYNDIKSCCIIGGICQEKQLRLLRKQKPQIVIATPGRLHDIVQSETIDYLNVQSIASIQAIVIDEADRMVQKGHFEEMLKIIDIVKESKTYRLDDHPYRVFLFSATLTFLHELPSRFKTKSILTKDSKMPNTKKKGLTPAPEEQTKKKKIKQMLSLFGIERSETRIIDLNDESSFGRPDSGQLSEFRINCLTQEKDLYLYYFLVQNPGKRALVFCNSKDCLRRLSNVLKFLGFETFTLHSEMDQKKRLSSLEKFRNHCDSILIATDVAARGLDIKDLDCVIHYQVPRTCESYIHRSGRTARLFKKGVSLTLCEPKEVPFYRRLCNNINQGKDLEDYEIEVDLKELLKDRVLLAQQCDKIDHRLRETKSNRNWFTKAAMECDIELDEEDIRQLSGKGKTNQQNVEDDANAKRQLSTLQKRLNTLLKKSLVTRRSVTKRSVDKLHID